MTSRLHGVPAFLLLGLLAGGCSGGGLDRLTGKVTLDGNPVAHAKVQFVRQLEDDSGFEAATAIGETNDVGKFDIKLNPNEGQQLMPGNYVIVVTKYVDRKSGKVPKIDGATGLDFTQLREAGQLRNALPHIYSDHQMSTIRLEIKEGNNLDLHFQLKSKQTP